MLAFGVGTLPTLLITGTLAGKLRQVLQGKRVRQISGILVVIFGVITIAAVLSHAQHANHSAHSALTAPEQHVHEQQTPTPHESHNMSEHDDMQQHHH
jgi:hypothetical protein